MALFTSKADADLPLNTTFFQLDLEQEPFEGSELDRWLATWLNRRYPSSYDLFSGLALVSGKSVDPELYGEYRNFQVVLRLLMNAFAEGQELTKSEKDLVNAALKEFLPAPKIIWNQKDSKHSIEFFDEPEPRAQMLMEIFDALTRENQERVKLFNKCEECRSSFVIQKEGQRFCSQR